MSHSADLEQVKIICIIENYKPLLIYFKLQIQMRLQFLYFALTTINLFQIMLQLFLNCFDYLKQLKHYRNNDFNA